MNELNSIYTCLTSGDPLTDSVVLMSRLEAEKWLGGHNSNPVTSSSITVPVNWEIATDPMFNQIVNRGVANASADRNWTIKVVADGLNEGTKYYYRFSHGSGAKQAVSATGETKTLPADPSQVRFAVLSCANFTAEEAFLAYGRVLEMHRQYPYDAILFLGDYIYEYGEGGYTAAESAKEARGFIPDYDVVTLDDYRARYQQYNSDVNLAALRAAAPWISIWDDHETANDSWKDGAENHDPSTQGAWQDRVQAAMQAYYEVMPIREPWLREGTDQASQDTDLTQGYRSFDFGTLLSLHVLETRLSARDEQLAYPSADDVSARIAAILADPALTTTYAQALGVTPPNGANDLAGITAFSEALIVPVQQELLVATVAAMLSDADRDLIGDQQMAWLQNEMASSSATWQLLGQQVLMQNMSLPAELLLNAGDASVLTKYALPLQKLNSGIAFEELSREEQALFSDLTKVPYNPDAWDGYGVERETIFQTAQQLGKTLVSLAGDTHNAWAGALHTMSDGVKPAGSQVGVELATPGVTSPGFEKYLPGADEAIRQNLPAVDGLSNLFTSYVNNLDFADLSHRGYLDVTVSADSITGRYELLNQSPSLTEPVWSQRTVSYGIDGNEKIQSTPVMRFYNPSTGLHHYTTEALEAALVDHVLGWNAEGESLHWFPNGTENQPSETDSTSFQHLYRLYSPTTGDHLFTINKEEMMAASTVHGYVLEGRAGRAFSASTTATTPVYRFYKPLTGAHFYTNSAEEANNVITRSLGPGYDLDNSIGETDLLQEGWGYVLEGVAFFA